MSSTFGNCKHVLGAGIFTLFLVAAAPTLAFEDLEPIAYVEMSDTELNGALQGWSELNSANRRGLLVEIKRRMEQPRPSRAILPAATTQVPRIRVHIRIHQTRRFGSSAQGQRAEVFTGGRLVIRGGIAPLQTDAAGAGVVTQLVALRPLSGPDFGRGFEQRQQFYRAGVEREAGAEIALVKLAPASRVEQLPRREETEQREK